MLIVVADSTSEDLTELLNDSGLPWKVLSSQQAVDVVTEIPELSGVLVCGRSDPEAALRTCETIQTLSAPIHPLLVLCSSRHAEQLAARANRFDDLILSPSDGTELRARITMASQRHADANANAPLELIEYDGLTINVVTYQASIHGRPLDLTYMEYKLLKFFVQHADRVLTREQLLRDVWEYAYYGGARTVDVHVRRLRAKLGEESAALIQTVRSVGYVFGRDRWDA